uniref:Uncharacterized protein n=1 Tax=Glossina austeni TaxID=7395 RepID=A0A1A9V6H6_GLOAU
MKVKLNTCSNFCAPFSIAARQTTPNQPSSNRSMGWKGFPNVSKASASGELPPGRELRERDVAATGGKRNKNERLQRRRWEQLETEGQDLSVFKIYGDSSEVYTAGSIVEEEEQEQREKKNDNLGGTENTATAGEKRSEEKGEDGASISNAVVMQFMQQQIQQMQQGLQKGCEGGRLRKQSGAGKLSQRELYEVKPPSQKKRRLNSNLDSYLRLPINSKAGAQHKRHIKEHKSRKLPAGCGRQKHVEKTVTTPDSRKDHEERRSEEQNGKENIVVRRIMVETNVKFSKEGVGIAQLANHNLKLIFYCDCITSMYKDPNLINSSKLRVMATLLHKHKADKTTSVFQ